MKNALLQAAIAIPADVRKPPPREVGGVKTGLNALLGIVLFIGPYLVAGGILVGFLALIWGMFGHQELKGVKYIVISVVAAIGLGSAFTIANIFV